LLAVVAIKQLNYGIQLDNVNQFIFKIIDKTYVFFCLNLGKYTIVDDNHTDWVSCVRFSPNQKDPLIVSAGWDKLVKVKTKTYHLFIH